MHYILSYEFVPDYLERRSEFRDQHMSHAKGSIDRGELFLGGAFADPADGAVLIFKGDTRRIPETFAETDPYVLNGLVSSWRVREWTTVVGRDAEHPIVS